jgi:hypothetical protein
MGVRRVRVSFEQLPLLDQEAALCAHERAQCGAAGTARETAIFLSSFSGQ